MDRNYRFDSPEEGALQHAWGGSRGFGIVEQPSQGFSEDSRPVSSANKCLLQDSAMRRQHWVSFDLSRESRLKDGEVGSGQGDN